MESVGGAADGGAAGELLLGKVLWIGDLGCQVVSEFDVGIYNNSVYCGINYGATYDYARAKLWQVLDLYPGPLGYKMRDLPMSYSDISVIFFNFYKLE